ncbi:MAG: hypothetical protein NTZ18_00880 [Candidatus Komeilibacteria bacterium]|nr:hypothetical protein [Candidatus Komeilibacteria bacterium]
MGKIIRTFILAGLLLAVAVPAAAAGISVKPDRLNFIMPAGQTATQNLVVENISASPVIFNLYFDELTGQLKVEPDNFRLEVGQKRQIKVTASPAAEGLLATNLSIVAQDLDRRAFNVAAGVKVPIVLQVKPAPAFLLPVWAERTALVLLLLAGAVIIALLVVLLKRKRTGWEVLTSKFKK